MEKNRKSKGSVQVANIVRPVGNICRRFWWWASSRKGVPILIGIFLGILLANSCQPECDQELVVVRHDVPVLKKADSQTSLILPRPVNHGNEDFEPSVLIDSQKIPPAVQKATRPVRPRYYASELGMHETLFVAIASSAPTLPSLGVALNRTAAHNLPRLTFFVSSIGPELWTKFQNLSMNIVRSSDFRTQMHPLLMLKFIVENHLETFDWFFIAPDCAYLRGKELLEFVKKMSVGRPVYMGVPLVDSETGYCDFSAGILLSQATMMGIAEHLPWCMEQAMSEDFSKSIGYCVLYIFGLRCSQSILNSEFAAFHITDPRILDSQDTTSELIDSEKILPVAISVYPIVDSKHFYRLHLELSQRKIGEIEQMIEDLQDDIVKQSPHTPSGGSDLHWPIGINAPIVPKNRFDVIEWMYFNESHLLRPDDFRVAVRLVGSHLKSVQQVLEFARKNIEERHVKQEVKISGTIKFRNGYVRFDPIRGMEYLLDLAYQTTLSDREVVQRFRLIRTLGQMEQISLPFVTENTRVHLTLPIVPADIPGAMKFLKSFTQTHLELQDNVFLMIIFLYGKTDPGKESPNDVFLKIKSAAKDIEKRYSKTLGTRLGWVSIRNPIRAPPSEFAVMDIVAKKFSKDSIIFRCNIHLIPSGDLLNRVRLSTIPGTQVYFPMPFVQYRPNIIYQSQPFPEDFDIKRQFGHYDRDAVDFASFFVSDYTAARRNEAENWAAVNADRDLLREYPRPNQAGQVYDLYTLFLSTDLHVFRGVEPALKVKFSMLSCDKDPKLDKRLLQRCETRLLTSLANKQQLALFVAHQDRAKGNSALPNASSESRKLN